MNGQLLNVSLWVAQALVFAALCLGGVMKLTMPVGRLSNLFAWTGQVPVPFLRFIGVVDLAGGVGILLPELTRVSPQLTVWAALGCALLMTFAIAFHVRRGELRDTPFNFFVLALCAFVLWGRWGL